MKKIKKEKLKTKRNKNFFVKKEDSNKSTIWHLTAQEFRPEILRDALEWVKEEKLYLQTLKI